MNNDTPTQPTTEKPTVGKTTKRKRVLTPRTRGPIDPGIAAIRAATAQQIKDYRAGQASAKILATITDKLLPKLTGEDCIKLDVVLTQHCTKNGSAESIVPRT